jgi:acyl carrier protein
LWRCVSKSKAPAAINSELACDRLGRSLYSGPRGKTRENQGRRRLLAGKLKESPMSVTEKEIEEKVISIVADQMGVDKGEISRDTSFVQDLNADSLDTVELVMEFEDEFETSIPDEQAEKIQTVGQAIDYIKQHVNKPKA